MSFSPAQQQLIQQFHALNNWENRYRLILRLGKAIPEMDDALKIDNVLLSGCESNVWFYAKVESEQLVLNIYSDAKIVRGLISLISESFRGLTLAQCHSFDCLSFFEELGLLSHLSPSRGNGIRAIITEIKKLAAS